MVSIMEIMHLCRLCLVKDQVNIPIFEDQGDIRQIFLKITACLPVKISKEDKLPKKICDGCLYKLELLYQFWNTTANAEKQLLTWIEQINMDVNTKATEEPISQPQEHTVKQEKIEPESTNDNVDLSTDAQSYILQQQQLPYQGDFPYKESQGSNADGVEASDNSEEPLSKRRRRRQATKPIPPESLDSSDNEAADSLLEMTVTKTEEESESDGDENVDDPESTKFVPTGTEDSEQPGPSGLGKGGAEAPLRKTRNHREEKYIWICKLCDVKFETRKLLRAHKKETHTHPSNEHIYNYIYNKTANTYSCKTCDHETTCKDEMEKHVLVHEEKFECEECKEIFYNAYKYALHVKKHDEHQPYRCPLCAYISFRRTSISQHINMIHLKKYLYYCQYCGKGFCDIVTYQEHESLHLGADPLICVVCQKSFSFTRNLLKHQIKLHKPMISGVQVKNQCKICKRSYSKASTLENHMKIHDKSKPKEKTHLCDTCGKGFAQRSKLVLHERVHTGYKPHKCSYCDKCFTKRDYLVMHERIHSGEKPYCCVYCGKCFNQDASLRIHVRTHTRERPYVCHLCNNGFVSKASLKMHFNKCTGNRF